MFDPAPGASSENLVRLDALCSTLSALCSLPLPRRVAVKAGWMLARNKRFDRRSHVAQPERVAVSRMAYGVVGPRQHNAPECVERGLEPLRTPRFARAALKQRV